MVQYIRSEGVELFERPKPPTNSLAVDTAISKHANLDKTKKETNKNRNEGRNFDTDPEWQSYCQWLNALSKQVVENFLRGIQIGVHLGESWLVSQGCIYIWNYLHSMIEKKNFGEQRLVVTILAECFEALKKCGHINEPELVVAISVALSMGLMHNWLPSEQAKQLQIPNLGGESGAPNEKQTRKGNPTTTGGNPQGKNQFSIPFEGQADIKKALEVCLHI